MIHFSYTMQASSVDVGLVGGGVGGTLFLVIIALVIIVFVLVCQVRRRGHVKFISGELKVNSPQLTININLIHACEGKGWVQQ